MRVRLAVAYWRDDGVYPRAGRAARRGEVYLRNIATMVATWHRVTRDLVTTEVDLCTNVEPTGHLRETLDGLAVQRVPVPFDHAPPPGYFDRFSGSLYSLDVLAHHARALDDDEALVLVDPDVVWLRRPERLLRRLAHDGPVVHEIPYGTDRRDLGITRRELGVLSREIASAAGVPEATVARLPEAPAYTGGELVAADRPTLQAMAPLLEEAWEGSLALWRAGRRPVLHTEEHILAHVLARLGRSTGNTDGIVRRVWTRGAGARNVSAGDLQLEAWHVLAEKTTGLWRLYDDLRADRGPFATGDEDAWVHALARRLGVDPGVARRVRLASEHTVRRLLRRQSSGNEG